MAQFAVTTIRHTLRQSRRPVLACVRRQSTKVKGPKLPQVGGKPLSRGSSAGELRRFDSQLSAAKSTAVCDQTTSKDSEGPLDWVGILSEFKVQAERTIGRPGIKAVLAAAGLDFSSSNNNNVVDTELSGSSDADSPGPEDSSKEPGDSQSLKPFLRKGAEKTVEYVFPESDGVPLVFSVPEWTTNLAPGIGDPQYEEAHESLRGVEKKLTKGLDGPQGRPLQKYLDAVNLPSLTLLTTPPTGINGKEIGRKFTDAYEALMLWFYFRDDTSVDVEKPDVPSIEAANKAYMTILNDPVGAVKRLNEMGVEESEKALSFSRVFLEVARSKYVGKFLRERPLFDLGSLDRFLRANVSAIIDREHPMTFDGYRDGRGHDSGANACLNLTAKAVFATGDGRDHLGRFVEIKQQNQEWRPVMDSLEEGHKGSKRHITDVNDTRSLEKERDTTNYNMCIVSVDTGFSPNDAAARKAVQDLANQTLVAMEDKRPGMLEKARDLTISAIDESIDVSGGSKARLVHAIEKLLNPDTDYFDIEDVKANLARAHDARVGLLVDSNGTHTPLTDAILASQGTVAIDLSQFHWAVGHLEWEAFASKRHQ